MHKYYRMKEGGGPAILIDHGIDAPKWNQTGYGIFWTVHEFEGERRKQNLTALNGFAIDVDQGDKADILDRVKTNLIPTWIIETKRGYHFYWLFKEPLECSYSEDLENRYKNTIVNRLIPYFNADPNAADLCRILRVPFFLHQKDPKDPFMIQVVQENPSRYTWEQIEKFFPDEKASTLFKKDKSEALKKLKLKTKGRDLFEKIYRLDCKQALEKLSGTEAVMQDSFEFKRNVSGTYNITVNNQSTSCWIDLDKKIGSNDHGGPTIWQWLFWYHRDHKKVYEMIKKYLPEVVNE